MTRPIIVYYPPFQVEAFEVLLVQLKEADASAATSLFEWTTADAQRLPGSGGSHSQAPLPHSVVTLAIKMLLLWVDCAQRRRISLPGARACARTHARVHARMRVPAYLGILPQ